MNWCVVVLCLCFVSCVYGSGNSLKDPYICGSPSCTPSEKFKYLPDIIYHYEYKVNVETYFNGSSNNRSTLFVKADVALQFINPCEGLLQLRDVTLLDQDESYPVERAEKFIHSVSQYDLRFAFHDGVISEICPEEAEDDWVLNFKRAILSLFQNSMKRFDVNHNGVELDIHGTCDVEYTVRGQDATSLVVVKRRNLSACNNRYKYMSILQTVRYSFQSKFQTWPVLKSESKCRVTVDHNVYKAVTCRERHLFEPFSGRNSSGGLTTVIQELELKEEKNKTDTEIMDAQPKAWSVIQKRANLLHHHLPVYGNTNSGELKSARDVLKLLCLAKHNTEEDTGPSSVDENMDSGSIVGLWGRLVRAARPLDHPALAQLLTRSTLICPEAKKHLLDALPYIASVGSVELIKEKILAGEVDQDTRHEWLMSMAMIPRPKAAMLKSMLELLQKQKYDKVVSFATSSMLHSYCKHSGKAPRECCEEESPFLIVSEFESIVHDVVSREVDNKTPREDRTKLVIAMKALGNIGGFNQEFADVLMNIIGDTFVPIPVRLTAIDAFRRTPCTETREYFLETFREDYVDIEIRLASYLQVMRCPDLSTVRKIFHALRNERVNQAATFVWSHLNNLGQSSLPSRVEIQSLLTGNPMPQLEDSPDFRMFSRNYEQSVFFDQYNAGGNYEANVIFSPDSYIPRSVSLNLTVDMFGESINIFEMKARGEGFETYFESIFGESGPLSKNKFVDALSNLRRPRRSLDDAGDVKRKVDDLGYKNEALKHRYPMAELGIKIFGNEISSWSAEGHDEIMRTLERMNPQLRILEILSGKEISYNKASLFLDTTFSVPTGSGLPLNLNLMGTSYMNTKLSGTMLDRFRETNNLDFQGKIRPSMAVNIAATMSVTAGGLATSGIRLNTRLYTATDLGATLSVRGLNVIRFDLSLPTNKQEIFAAKSELMVLHGDEELQQQGLNTNRIQNNTCSWSTFDNALGIKVCAKYQFPDMTNIRNAPYFLLSGPAKYIVSLERADPSAKTYSFEYKWDKNDTMNRIAFSYNTPDSQEKRSFDAILTLSNTTSTALLSMHCKGNVTTAKALYRNMPYDKSLEASLDEDGKTQFEAKMSLKRHPIKYGFVWVPYALWVIKDDRVAALTGTFKVKSKSGVTQCDILTEFQTKQLGIHLEGYYTINGPTHGTKLQLDYQFFRNPRQKIKLEAVYSQRSLGFRSDIYGDLAMEFSAYPAYDFYAVLRNVRTLSHVDIKFNVSASRAQKSDPAFTFGFMRIDTLNGMKLDTHLTLKRPRLIKTQFQFEEYGSKYSVLALLNFNPNSKEIRVSGFLFYPRGTQLYVDTELNVTLPNLRDMTLKAKVHEKMPNEYQLNALGVWFDGVDFNVDALYQDQSKTNMMSHRLKVLINSSHFKEIAVDARFTQDNRQITFIGQGKIFDDEYRTLIRYIVLSEQNFTAYCELDVTGRAYSVTLNADLNNNTNVNVDIHYDQERDIHIAYQRWLTPRQKRLLAVLNWNANRNPEDKVSIDIQLDNKGVWHHGGAFTLFYPEKQINGEFEFQLKDWFCQWHVLTSWSQEANILWRVKMYSEARNETVYALLSNMKTPFLSWEDTSLNLMWRYHDNLQAINGSMNWQKDYLAFSLLADYLFKSNEFYGEINAVVNSTIPTLPRAAAMAKHHALWKKKADTLLSFQYNDEGLLMMNSSWTLDRGRKENNITGLVTLITPFQGYRRGFLKTEFVLGHKKDIHGVTFLDMEQKSLKISVNGHMRRITNCMLEVVVTRPMSDLEPSTARIGFIEAHRHLVAMLHTPNSTTGIEVLLNITSLQQFHVFGHVALPIQYLNRAMLTAKRGLDEVDFRVGWGTMDLGFTGIWQYRSPANFVYLYKLYTPLEGFEENGLVLKNVYGKGLDTELSVRLSKHKFGVKILLVDNGKGLIDVLSDRLKRGSKGHDELIENFDTTASVVLDTLYYPTVTFRSHLMKFEGAEQETIVTANATLHLPNDQTIVLTDVFVLEDYTLMRNSLTLSTPYAAVRQLRSLYTVDITLGEKINVTATALLHNGSHWHEISAKVFYENENGEDDAYLSYVASLAIVTPLPVLPALDARVAARLEDALWKMTADIAMPSFTVAAKGRLELDDPFVETSGSLNLTSPFLEDYFIKMEFKKDFAEAENNLGGGIQIQQGENNNYMFADVVWRPPPNRHIRFKSRGALYPVLTHSELGVLYSEEDGLRTLTVDLDCENHTYSLKGDQRPRSISVALSTPHPRYRAMKVVGEFEGEDNVRGSFTTDSAEYSISGKVLNKQPLDITLVLTPKGSGAPVDVRMKYTNSPTQYGVSAHVTGAVVATVHANVDLQDNYTDVNFKVDIPRSKYKDIYFKSRVDVYPELRRVVSVQAATPFDRIARVNGNTDFVFGPKTGYLLCDYELPRMKGNGTLKWSFIIGDLFVKAVGDQLVVGLQRSVELDVFFGDKLAADGLPTTRAGFRMDLDKVWLIGANATFGYILDQRLSLAINAILPKPNVDVHTLRIEGSLGNKDDPHKTLDAQYATDVTKIITGVKGKMLLLEDSVDTNCTITWTAATGYKVVDNLVVYRWDVNGSRHLQYALRSPLYEGDDTFTVRGTYQKDMVHGYHIAKGVMHRPGRSQIGEVDLRYGGFSHSDGHFNLTTPFKRLPWLKAIFDVNNLEDHSDNKVDLFWPNKCASFNTTHTYVKQADGFTQDGLVSLSIPLNTQHLVHTQYYYVQGDRRSNGNATIDFDSERFVSGSFNQVVKKSQRNLDLATTDIRVENDNLPIGVKYIHEYDDVGKIDAKQATVFHLHNATKFNMTGKLDVLTHDTGKEVQLTALHGNRTWAFHNHYSARDNQIQQGSKVTWADDVWIQYKVHVTNMTTSETESQRVIMNVWYPRRSFVVDAVYRLQDTLLDGTATLTWDVKQENKTAQLRGRWESPEGNLHNVDLALSHPSFRKDVTLTGQYISTPAVMSNVSVELQYSDYENEYLKLSSILTDNSNGPIRDYKFYLKCTHPSTNLDLDMKSDINIHSKWYYFNTYYRFQKSLFYQKLRHNKFLIDMNRAAVNWEKANETYYYRLNGTWDLTYPNYRALAWVARPSGNDTGVATLSMRDKSLVAHYNSTDDISYHVIGRIIDTRSARFDAWRDYDDITTVDLASYIRLNHSRLLTSSLVWRPQIFSQVKAQAVYGIKMFYGQINDTLVIMKEAPMEAHLALKNIWTDAKPRLRDFLEDLNDLHVIKDDLDDFEKFLNESYGNNDFYVRDIVEFTYYVLDEMAVRNHMESLPGLVNDMWGMMGNTSKSIKESLNFVIESIKKAYANFLESVNRVLEADLMELVSDKLEAMIMQYDTFVQDLHMKFLEFWEETWVNATTRLYKYWNDLLKSCEPLFWKVVHYTEKWVVGLGEDLIHFFHSTSDGITNTKYFNFVATFGQEVDKIYKDLVNNDLFDNIRKYTGLVWKAIWSKIGKYIPFQEEVSQLYAEFKNAIHTFLRTEQVVHIREKFTEAYTRLKWWYDYFLIGEALQRLGAILYDKVTDFARTALQYEELHRTPKTNFIFDPRKGEILLEQKLPMSWHAFNRTPDFTEIAEYRAVRDFLDQWLTTNKSIWSYYYEIRPYLDFNNILPPFAGMAMMTGQGTLVTFDKRVLTVSAAGTFLLTKDYRQNNFTVLMESNDQGRYNLLVLTKKHLIHIDLYKEQVSIGSKSITLPAEIDGVVVDRQTDTLTVSGRQGLDIQCNFLFYTCRLQVAGWYYANLGGLLGTYNNEQCDDLQLPNNTYTASIAEMERAWNIEPSDKPPLDNHELKNDTQCDKFFQNKVSPLHPCFTVIDAMPFYAECVLGVDACALASAYLELCSMQHVPVHIPDHCVQCSTPQGEVVEEGSFFQLQHVANSTDVVFLVQAQYCNTNIRKRKNIDLFLEAFDTKLQASGLSDNRYAVVGFGGSGVFRRPRALYVNNRIFTNSLEVALHFDGLLIDKADQIRRNHSYKVDMFSALSFGTQLPFRAGVPRTFILVPCTRCDNNFMRLDYSTIQHNLLENSVTLHILMDGEFTLAKKRANKYLFGIDSAVAYTNKDYERLTGDAALRKQVKLPKDKLSVCTSLALETNGTIFAGPKLMGERSVARRFSTVVGARAAVSARPCPQAPRCECREARLHCPPCAQHNTLMELPFWNVDEIEELIDVAMDPPIPAFS